MSDDEQDGGAGGGADWDSRYQLMAGIFKYMPPRVPADTIFREGPPREYELRWQLYCGWLEHQNQTRRWRYPPNLIR